jgi:PAS domain S-box-containing protein
VEPELQEHSPLLLFTLAVVASSIRGGYGPGLLATALGAMGGVYFFPPTHAFAIEAAYLHTAVFQLTQFLVAGGVMSWLGGELRTKRWQVEDYARQRDEIIDSITDGFAAFDSGGRMLYANRSVERLTGNSHAELIEKTLWQWLAGKEGTRRTQLADKIRQVLDERIRLDLEVFWEPTRSWLEFHAYPSRNKGLTLYISDITARKAADEQLRTTLGERDSALENVRLLTGLLPICAACKKIRDVKGNWHQMESYIEKHSEAQFSHGMCPECAREFYPEIMLK